MLHSSNLIFGLPEFWRGDIENFWYYVMLRNGFVSIQDLTERTEVGGEKIGMCFSPASLDGYNFYYQYTHANISNPTLSNTLHLEIGKECALCCLTPDKMGIQTSISSRPLVHLNWGVRCWQKAQISKQIW